MLKFMKKIIIAILIFLPFFGCEKDDICPANTPTTPQLVIEFFDFASNASKAVTKLKIEDSESGKLLNVFNEAKIKLPLKTDVDISKYSLTLNSDTPSALNLDKLEIKYSRSNVYISRACGYITVFNLNNSPSFLVSENTVATEWIKKITITKPNILNEDETHIKIFF